MAVVSKASANEIVRSVFVVLIAVGVAIFCARDGFFKKDTPIGTVTAVGEDGKTATVKAETEPLLKGGDIRFEGPETDFTQEVAFEDENAERVKAGETGRIKVEQKVAVGDKVLRVYAYRSFNQFVTVLGAAAAVFFIVKIALAAGFTMKTDERGISVRGREPIPWDAFTDADTSRLAKGILKLSYTTGGVPKTLKLDDVKQTNVRELIDEINRYTDLNIELPAGRAPSPPPESAEIDESPPEEQQEEQDEEEDRGDA